MTHAESLKFEKIARHALEKKLKTTLQKSKIPINGRNKEFDFVNMDKRIVGDAKYIKKTKSGNFPRENFTEGHQTNSSTPQWSLGI